MYAAVPGGEHAAGMLRLLVDAGADANKQTKDGWTALMAAARFGEHAEAMIYVLAYAGADLNKKNNSGETAIDLASNDEIKEYIQNIYAEIRRTTFAGNVLMSGRGPGPAEICDWKAYIPYVLWCEIFDYAVSKKMIEIHFVN